MNRRFVLFGSLMRTLYFARSSEAASYRQGYNSCSIAIPAVNTQVTLAGVLSMAKIIYDDVKQPFKENLEITVKNQTNSAVRCAHVVRYNPGDRTDQATTHYSDKVTRTTIPVYSNTLDTSEPILKRNIR